MKTFYLLLESSSLDHDMKKVWEEKKERCDQKIDVQTTDNNIEATTTTTTTTITEPNLKGGSYTFNANSMLLLISMIVLHASNKF